MREETARITAWKGNAPEPSRTGKPPQRGIVGAIEVRDSTVRNLTGWPSVARGVRSGVHAYQLAEAMRRGSVAA
jgi:hypothetical protein